MSTKLSLETFSRDITNWSGVWFPIYARYICKGRNFDYIKKILWEWFSRHDLCVTHCWTERHCAEQQSLVTSQNSLTPTIAALCCCCSEPVGQQNLQRKWEFYNEQWHFHHFLPGTGGWGLVTLNTMWDFALRYFGHWSICFNLPSNFFETGTPVASLKWKQKHFSFFFNVGFAVVMRKTVKALELEFSFR